MSGDLKSIIKWVMGLYLIGILIALPLFMGMKYPIPLNYYLWVKLFHILGVIAFLGNMSTGPLWLIFANRTKNTSFISSTMKAMCWADVVFTVPGLMLAIITGLQMANTNWGGYFNLSWLAAALILLVLSSFVGVPAMILQYKLYSICEKAAQKQEPLPEEYSKVVNQWSWWGTIAGILPIISFMLMVLKPNLW